MTYAHPQQDNNSHDTIEADKFSASRHPVRSTRCLLASMIETPIWDDSVHSINGCPPQV